MYNVSFTYLLITDTTFRREYEYSKGDMTLQPGAPAAWRAAGLSG
jgi:hypothetical protein